MREILSPLNFAIVQARCSGSMHTPVVPTVPPLLQAKWTNDKFSLSVISFFVWRTVEPDRYADRGAGSHQTMRNSSNPRLYPTLQQTRGKIIGLWLKFCPETSNIRCGLWHDWCISSESTAAQKCCIVDRRRWGKLGRCEQQKNVRRRDEERAEGFFFGILNVVFVAAVQMQQKAYPSTLACAWRPRGCISINQIGLFALQKKKEKKVQKRARQVPISVHTWH